MKLFDKVHFVCPACYENLEVESESDLPNSFINYCTDTIPKSVADNINGKHTSCSNCGASYEVVIQEIMIYRHELKPLYDLTQGEP